MCIRINILVKKSPKLQPISYFKEVYQLCYYLAKGNVMIFSNLYFNNVLKVVIIYKEQVCWISLCKRTYFQQICILRVKIDTIEAVDHNKAIQLTLWLSFIVTKQVMALYRCIVKKCYVEVYKKYGNINLCLKLKIYVDVTLLNYILYIIRIQARLCHIRYFLFPYGFSVRFRHPQWYKLKIVFQNQSNELFQSG